MKPFATYQVSKQLAELKFNEDCIASYQQMQYPINDSGNDYNKSLCLTIDCEMPHDEQKVLWIEKENAHFHWNEGNYENGEHSRCELEGVDCKAPLWEQVKEWLWKNHKLVVSIDINKNKQCFCCIRNEDMVIIIPNDILSENWIPNFFDSPIDAEIDGIKKIIAHLYDEHLKTKSV